MPTYRLILIMGLLETSLYHIVDGNPNTLFQFGTANAGNQRIDYTPPAGDILTFVHSVVIRKIDGVDYTNTCVIIDDDATTKVCARCEYGHCESGWAAIASSLSGVEDASPFITFLFNSTLRLILEINFT